LVGLVDANFVFVTVHNCYVMFLVLSPGCQCLIILLLWAVLTV